MFDYSSTQVDLPDALSRRVRAFAAGIPDDQLAEDGREQHPHITLKYGLHTDDPADVVPLLAGEPPITARLGRTSIFTSGEIGGDYDVLKVDVDSPDLHRLNKTLAGALPHTDTHPIYQPHVTIAYVKAGHGAQYAGDGFLQASEVSFHHVTFSARDGTATQIPLGDRGMPKTAADVMMTTRDEDEDEDEDGEGRQASDQPDAADVHRDGYLGGKPSTPSGSHFVTKLLSNLRARMKQRGMVRSDEFAAMVTSARSHAGGKAKAERRTAASESAGALEGTLPCTACAAGNLSDCACPGCLALDACWCALAMGREQPAGHDAAPTPSDDGGDADGTGRVASEPDPDKDPEGDGDTEDGDTEEKDPGDGGGSRLTAPRRASDPLLSVRGEAFRLLLPCAFAEAPAWIPYLPVPGSYQHPSYGEIAITRERNQDMVGKFNAGTYQRGPDGQPAVPIDGEHETKVSGAMGWIRAMRMNADGSADARVEWTDRGRQMLAENRYQFFSPEWYDAWTDPATGQKITNVAIGGALTTRPYFKSNAQGQALRPLVANEQGIYVPGEDAHPVPPLGAGEFAGAPRAGAPEAPEGQEITSMAGETTTVQLGEEQARRFAEMERENAAFKQMAEANKQAAEAAQAEAKQAAERITAMETAAQRRAFAETAREWQGDKEEIVSFMEAVPAAQLEWFIKRERAHAEQIRQSGLFSEKGSAQRGADDPQERLQSVIKTRMAEKSLTYAEAARQIASEQPELVGLAKQATEVRA